MNMNVKKKGNAGFTLLELLIVISIIAILAVALVLVLNPGETLKKSRDAQRISDLGTIKTALGIYLTSTSTPIMGACTASRDSQAIADYDTDGTGWIDVNLNALTGGAPISTLPRDPISDGTYSYKYECEQGTMTFEVSTKLESQAYTVDDNKAATDGGSDPLRYEVGTKLSL